MAGITEARNYTDLKMEQVEEGLKDVEEGVKDVEDGLLQVEKRVHGELTFFFIMTWRWKCCYVYRIF